jgi:NTE family protein
VQPDGSVRFPRPLAFVLPGGGALGAYQAGSLLAFAEAGLKPDLLIGVSAGGLNAAHTAFHPGPTGARDLVGLWRRLARRDILPITARSALAGLTRRRSFVADNAALNKFIASHLPANDFTEAQIPLAIVATDLATGDPIVMHSGELTSALLASAALPGIYPPIVRDGRVLIDGGVVANVPLGAARQLGARTALVVPVPKPAVSAGPLGPLEMLMLGASLGIEEQSRLRIKHPPDGMLTIDIPTEISPVTTLDFSHGDELSRLGYIRTRQWFEHDGFDPLDTPEGRAA